MLSDWGHLETLDVGSNGNNIGFGYFGPCYSGRLFADLLRRVRFLDQYVLSGQIRAAQT